MSTVTLTIKNAGSTSDLATRFAPDANNIPRSASSMAQFIKAFATGNHGGSIDVQLSSANPVSASGTITLTYASIANSDTVTIAGQALTCVTGTPTTAQFKKLTDATVTAANLADAINAHATLSKYFSATSALGVVTVTCLVKGGIGNLLAMTTSNGTGFALVQLSGGTGGAEGAATSFVRT